MVDSKENYKFDVGVRGLSAVTRPPFSFTGPPSEPYRRGMSLEEKKAQPIAFKSGGLSIISSAQELLCLVKEANTRQSKFFSLRNFFELEETNNSWIVWFTELN